MLQLEHQNLTKILKSVTGLIPAFRHLIFVFFIRRWIDDFSPQLSHQAPLHLRESCVWRYLLCWYIFNLVTFHISERKQARRDLHNTCVGLARDFGSRCVLWNLSYAMELLALWPQKDEFVGWVETYPQAIYAHFSAIPPSLGLPIILHLIDVKYDILDFLNFQNMHFAFEL